MSNWFFAANGQQQGPYPEAQFRDLIANGTVRADTLVWSEGMAGWQKAAEVPGLMASVGGPPAMPHAGGPPAYADAAGEAALAIDFGILEFVWRFLVLIIGVIFVIPAPWALVWFTRWIVTCVRVPGRPNLTFTAKTLPAVIVYFAFLVLSIAVALIGIDWLNQLMVIVQIALYWLFMKWVIENLASNGQNIGLSFSGSIWGYLGWSLLGLVALITIIGWAWVYAAMARWMCRNIQGTRREVVFVGTGLDILWRVIVAVIACAFIIPIPWVYRWMLNWWASQTRLVPRGAT